MELTMYLGNDFIESVPLNLDKISQPGYLGSFKRTLKQKYVYLINQAREQPEFLLISTQPANRGATKD